jgi:hypothetical protein
VWNCGKVSNDRVSRIGSPPRAARMLGSALRRV